MFSYKFWDKTDKLVIEKFKGSLVNLPRWAERETKGALVNLSTPAEREDNETLVNYYLERSERLKVKILINLPTRAKLEERDFCQPTTSSEARN